MAKQIGHQIKGRIDDYSFYHDRVHGYLVRRTGGITSKEYKTDQRYAAARDASSEFANVSKTGKLIREALSPFIQQVKDGTMVNRMNKELVALKQLDNKNPRGKRRPEIMLADMDANKWFRIFQFNAGVKIYELMGTSQSLAPAKNMSQSLAPAEEIGTSQRLAPAIGGNFCVPTIDPSKFPEGATHAGLTEVRTVIDFEKGYFETSSSRMGLVSKAEVSYRREKQKVFSQRCADEDGAYQSPVFFQKELSLHIEASENLSSVSGTEIVCLQVLFFREENGRLIQLEGRVHSMGIIGIRELRVSDFKLEIAKGILQIGKGGINRKHRKLKHNIRLSGIPNLSPMGKRKREIEPRGR